MSSRKRGGKPAVAFPPQFPETTLSVEALLVFLESQGPESSRKWASNALQHVLRADLSLASFDSSCWAAK
eukprot:700332-Pelagomonas_calceolata.AAC.1